MRREFAITVVGTATRAEGDQKPGKFDQTTNLSVGESEEEMKEILDKEHLKK